MPVWHPHPDVWFLMVALCVGYLIATRTLAPEPLPVTGAADPPRSDRRHTFYFLAGVAALWIGADWPIHELSEGYLFSVHMVQHTLFSLVAPPLLLLGMPEWLVRKLLSRNTVFQAFRFLTRPLIALVLFNGVVLATHWPVLTDAGLRSEPLHFVLHFVLFSSALLMWWPVIDRVPELKRLSEPGKMFYLFLQSILPTVPASFLTFAEAPIYHFYETVPRLWGIGVLDDQQWAGLIMKIGGGLLLWLCIATIYFRWAAREERGHPTEEISWEAFERELDVWDLRKP